MQLPCQTLDRQALMHGETRLRHLSPTVLTADARTFCAPLWLWRRAVRDICVRGCTLLRCCQGHRFYRCCGLWRCRRDRFRGHPWWWVRRRGRTLGLLWHTRVLTAGGTACTASVRHVAAPAQAKERTNANDTESKKNAWMNLYIYIYIWTSSNIYIYKTINDRPAKPPRRWFVRVDRDTAPTAYFCSPPIGGWSTAQADPQAGPRRWPVYRAGGPSRKSTAQVAGLPRRYRPVSQSTTQVAGLPHRRTIKQGHHAGGRSTAQVDHKFTTQVAGLPRR